MNLWSEELKRAVYSPNFSLSDLNLNPIIEIHANLIFPEGKKYEGILTNWDRVGVFFVPTKKMPRMKKLVKLQIKFKDLTFTQEGEIVSQFDQGVGIRFNNKSESEQSLNWEHYYRILEDRGYYPK
jgi:hypothetical protein